MALLCYRFIPIDVDLNTSLHIAVKLGNINKVYEILRYHPDVNQRNIKHQTPLHLCVAKGHYHIISHLVFHGANVEKMDSDGKRPIHMIKVCPKKIECLEQLVFCKVNINGRDTLGCTLLHLAVKEMHGETELIKKLLVLGADPNGTDYYGNNILHYFAEKTLMTDEELDTISVILSFKLIDLDKKNKLKETPLYIAVTNNNTRLVRLLLENGADMFAECSRKITPFDLAVEEDKGNVLTEMMTHIAFRQDFDHFHITHKINTNATLKALYKSIKSEIGRT